jgi:hypothetical protein
MFEIIANYKNDIEALYKSGLSIRKVANTLNLKVGTVGAYIKELGLSRNDFNGCNNPFYGKTHSKEFKEKHSKRMKGSIPNNKGKSKYGNGTIPRLLIEVWKSNARKRNILFNISYEEIDNLWSVQNGKCALTGRTMSNKYNSKRDTKVSLDRIDSNKPYTIDNVQLVTGIVNIAKNTMNNLEFIALCKEVANHVNDKTK